MQIALIIGLGNPEKEYAGTYHNVGADFIAYLRETDAFSAPANRLLTPDTFMNETGEFVRRTLIKTKVKPEGLLIVHDDSDIALGKIKYAFGRGAAGHKGVVSIITALKTKNFWRLRIGIRGHTNRSKAGAFVLRKISTENKIMLRNSFKEAVLKMPLLLSGKQY